MKPAPFKGRGSSVNIINRFEKNHYKPDITDELIAEQVLPRTEFLPDSSRTVVSTNNSPDIGFNFSVNPYRGCEHGCAYCYARPSHEYLGYSAGLDFETKIFVKEKAPALLRDKLMSRSWKPELIMMSGITDCYQPVERKLELTRGCLRVLADFRNPVSLITKNHLVTRDIDIFKELAEFGCVSIYISITTLDADLGGTLEPRTSRPLARLKTIEELAKAGIPVGVNVAPVIPGLTDHEMPKILKAAKEAGASSAGMTPLRLPGSVLPIFEEWLEQHRPERKAKVLSLIRSLRGGKLNDANFGSRMRGEGAIAENLQQMFQLYKKKFGLDQKRLKLTAENFVRPGDQLSLI
jgi:DNA repair photolyase